MPLTDKDRTRYRRQRRRRKVHVLKAKLGETTESKARKRLIAKIQKLSPWVDRPEK